MANMWVSEVELRDLLGVDTAKAFVRIMGGQRLYIPQNATPDHPLARTIGMIGMRGLCHAFAGETISLPSSRERDTAKKQIQRLLAEGKSHGQIAQACKVTHRYVEAVVQRLRQEKSAQQGSLLV